MISYEEYKKDYFNGRSLAKALKNEMTEERFLLYYFMDCFAEDSDEVNENLYKEKERLVDLAIVLAENQSKNNNISVIYDEFYFVLSLLERIDYNASELDRMEVACHENIQDILSSLKQKKFEEYFYENLNNLNLFVKHTRKSNYKLDRLELNYQSDIFYKNYKDVVHIGMDNPNSIVDWFLLYKSIYNRRAAFDKYTYNNVYFTLLQMSIQKCKEMNRVECLSEYIIEREKFLTKKEKNIFKCCFRKYVLGIILGYGERVENVVLSILIFGIIMSGVYMKIDVDGLPESGCERIIASCYFFVTTSLTIGYGDIKPETSFSRIVVMINQIVGFFLSGSLVTLYLRKWFRE